jgi:hypothetical protein
MYISGFLNPVLLHIFKKLFLMHLFFSNAHNDNVYEVLAKTL